MTIKELERCLIFDGLTNRWIPPRRGRFYEYSVFQQRLKMNDGVDSTNDVKKILQVISHLPDMPASYRPGGIFHHMERVFYDGYDSRFTLYIFSDLRDYDDDWLNR